MEGILWSIIGSMMLFLWWILILLIPVLIIYLVALWRLFKKAGRKGWEAIVPFYNTWVLAEISGVAWWYPLIIILSGFEAAGDGILGSILSLASILSSFFIYYNLSKKFHRGVGHAVLLTLFPWIMVPIMGFSSNYQYDKDVEVSENGPIGENGQSSSYSSSSVNNESNDYIKRQYCQYCGKQINGDAKYCANCGNEIKK